MEPSRTGLLIDVNRRLLRLSAPKNINLAFTLVELLIVIGIMAIIMGIVVPGYVVMSSQHRRNTCASNLKAIGQALAIFREDYQTFPPDTTEMLVRPEDANKLNGNPQPADLIHAAYDTNGQPVNTEIRGLGLFSLFYVGAYARALPPYTLEPSWRLGDDLRSKLASERKGLNGLLWFRGSGYITNLEVFHCPSNPIELKVEDLTDRTRLPELRGWNNYDVYYRRNFWHSGRPTPGVTDNRNLFQPYPPADTVVTWCPYHRKAQPQATLPRPIPGRHGRPGPPPQTETPINPPEYPPGPGIASPVRPGDMDLVLFADGTVRRMVSQSENHMYSEPSPGAGWPEGPIM